MSVFEILSIVTVSIGGLWAAGAALISLYSRTKERADAAERKSLSDSVESVRSLSHETKSQVLTEVRGFIQKLEETSKDLFTKYHAADKAITQHEGELKRLMDRLESVSKEWAREADRLWKAIETLGKSQVKELGEGARRVSESRKKTD